MRILEKGGLMKSLNGGLLAKIGAFRNVLGVSKEELQALEKPAETIDIFSRENWRLKSEVKRLEKALGYRPRTVLPNCIGCGTGRMSGSVDGFTCGESICRDRAIDIFVETRPARNGHKRAQQGENIVEI